MLEDGIDVKERLPTCGRGSGVALSLPPVREFLREREGQGGRGVRSRNATALLRIPHNGIKSHRAMGNNERTAAAQGLAGGKVRFLAGGGTHADTSAVERVSQTFVRDVAAE